MEVNRWRYPDANRMLFLCLIWITCCWGVEIEPSESLTVNTGEAIDLQCESAEGSPLVWYLSGVPIEESSSITITELTDATSGARTSFLSIDKAQESNMGHYSCRNPDDYFDSDEVVVTVVAGSNDVQITEPAGGELTLGVGRSFTLKCNGDTNMQLTWTHNGMSLTTSSRLIITEARDVDDLSTISILTRTSISLEDQGNYVCSDADDTFNRASVQVTVQEAAVTDDPVDIVTPSGSSLTVTEGEHFMLQCEGPEVVELQWFFGEVMTTMFGTKYTINTAATDGKQISMLTKDEADADDSGQYTCRNANNQDDHDTVTVAVRKPGQDGPGEGAVPTEMRTLVMSVGSSLNLQCSFEAPGDHVSEWTKDDVVLSSGRKYVINKNLAPSVLKIHNTDRSDIGVYKCSFKDAESGDVVGVVVFNVTTVPCPPLMPPVNGSFDSCPEYPVLGDTCTFECNSGFKLYGRTPTTCEQDEEQGAPDWTEDVPKCGRPGDSFWEDLFGGGSAYSSRPVGPLLGLLFLLAIFLRQF